VFLWLERSQPLNEKNFKKIEDCELTVLQDWLICSSRNAGLGAKPGVLPLLAHIRADRPKQFADWIVHGSKRCRNIDL
jgi:hypothetical protein